LYLPGFANKPSIIDDKSTKCSASKKEQGNEHKDEEGEAGVRAEDELAKKAYTLTKGKERTKNNSEPRVLEGMSHLYMELSSSTDTVWPSDTASKPLRKVGFDWEREMQAAVALSNLEISHPELLQEHLQSIMGSAEEPQSASSLMGREPKMAANDVDISAIAQDDLPDGNKGVHIHQSPSGLNTDSI
jgi:hypothetical protein